MSVYLNGTSVLLNAGKVATNTACCCGVTCDCSPGVSVRIDMHATASGPGCATMDVTDSLSFSRPAGFTFFDFTTHHDCLAGCTFGSAIDTRVVYVGNIFCSSGVLNLFINAVSACCYEPIITPCVDPGSFGGCNCGSVSLGSIHITCSGIYHFSFGGPCGGLSSCSIDVTVTVTIP